ncbi:hypothetical protein HNP81_000409 [Peribacillus huizhouensis]|uniref:Uncharacterized protein n=1 Tax=Peribacillus huizhouensis TaxID=1501239 RepID=A0ABR6CJH0_9BACI|nr:hypothetical protein [Peribacillus huizhouensis]
MISREVTNTLKDILVISRIFRTTYTNDEVIQNEL